MRQPTVFYQHVLTSRPQLPGHLTLLPGVPPHQHHRLDLHLLVRKEQKHVKDWSKRMKMMKEERQKRDGTLQNQKVDLN